MEKIQKIQHVNTNGIDIIKW
jgi:hypothetical protein